MFKPSEPSSPCIKITLFWPSGTPPISRTSGKICSGPSRFRRKMLLKDARFKNSTTTCGTLSETKPRLISLPTPTLNDLLLLVSPSVVDSLSSHTLISIAGTFSTTFKSSPTDAPESVTPTGPNGWKLKFNPIQSTSVSRVIQFASFHDASLLSATTSTQDKDTHATRRPRHVLPPVLRDTNGEFKNWTLSSQTSLKPLPKNKRRTKKLEESSVDSLTTFKTTRPSRTLLGLTETDLGMIFLRLI